MVISQGNPGSSAVALRSKGLRATVPRQAVLQEFITHGGHWSADGLLLQLQQSGRQAARTTVYYVLADLAKSGILSEVRVNAGALRYEIKPSQPHDHFVCRQCESIIDVPATDEPGSLAWPVRAGLCDSVDVVYRGICNDCRANGSGR